MSKRAQKTSKFITLKYGAMLQSSISDLNLNEELRKYPYILWDVLENHSDFAAFYREEFAGFKKVVCAFDFFDDHVEWKVDFNLSAYEDDI